jgi:hypothetical protein
VDIFFFLWSLAVRVGLDSWGVGLMRWWEQEVVIVDDDGDDGVVVLDRLEEKVGCGSLIQRGECMRPFSLLRTTHSIGTQCD